MSELRSVTAVIGLPGCAASFSVMTDEVTIGAMGAIVRASALADFLTSLVWVGSRMISLTGCRNMNVLPERLSTLGEGVASVRI